MQMNVNFRSRRIASTTSVLHQALIGRSQKSQEIMILDHRLQTAIFIVWNFI